MPNPIPGIYYKGRHDRSGQTEDTPPDHGVDELNIQFFEKGCGTRYGFNKFITAPGAWNGTVLRAHVFESAAGAHNVLILDDLHQLWTTENLAAPIKTFPGTVTDFALRSLYNRAYISPHNGTVGTTAEFVYVHQGAATFRKAAGVAPTGYTLGAAIGPAGHVEIGTHLFTVCYEFDTGYISPPAFTGTCVASYASPAAANKVTLTAIPLGVPASGHVGRYIVATAVLGETYNGNPVEQEWFFVPNGHIADNTTATLDVDFYDADLLSSADYLQYQLAEIPAGVALADYNGRLVVIGDPVKPHNPWISSVGNVESISTLDGFITVDPGDAGEGCKNGVSNRGILFITKPQRTYTTQDNGAAPSTWQVDRIDSAVGAECHSIGKILNIPGATQDTIFIADRSGLYMFPSQADSSEPLTWKIENLWRDINQEYFNTVQVVVDMIEQVIYINAPLDTATTPDVIIMGDFKLGLAKEDIRWSLWQVTDAAGVVVITPTSIWLEVNDTTHKPNFRFGSSTANTYKYVPLLRTDLDGADLSAINSFIQFGPNPEDSGGAIFQLGEIRFRIIGSGVLNVAVEGLDATGVVTLPSLTLAAAPGAELSRKCNVMSEKLSVSLQTYSGTNWFSLICMRLDIGPLWYDRPTV